VQCPYCDNSTTRYQVARSSTTVPGRLSGMVLVSSTLEYWYLVLLLLVVLRVVEAIIYQVPGPTGTTVGLILVLTCYYY